MSRLVGSMFSAAQLQRDPLRALTVIETTAVVLSITFDAVFFAVETPYLPLLHPYTFTFTALATLVCAVATFAIPHRSPGRKALVVLAAAALVAASIEPPYGVTPLVLAGVLAARLSFAYGWLGAMIAWIGGTSALVARLSAQSNSMSALGKTIAPPVMIYSVGTLAVILGLIFGTVAVAATYANRAAEAGAAEERARIALDLHDALGHGLTALAVQLQNAAHLRASDAARADAYLALATRTSSGLLNDVRSAVGVLRNGTDAPEQFELRIERLLREFAESSAANVRRHIALSRDLDAATGMALYRVVQEALTNVARHACATDILVELVQERGGVRAMVCDDGRGFDTDRPQVSNGLDSIRERVDAVGGTVRVESAPGAGTSVCAWIPLR